MVMPTVAEFKSYFNRDFPYGTDISTSVTDADITRALAEAQIHFNESLFTVEGAPVAFLNLAAHHLVMNLRASAQGLGGSYAWLESSKSVGSVSTSASIPQSVLESPIYSMLSKTNYGAKYLHLALGALVGQVFVMQGRTQA